MKNCIALIILFLTAASTYAQWTKLYTGVQEDLNAIHFTDSNYGYICGENGYVGRTTNGGKNWTDVSISKPFELHDLFFLDSIQGFVVGMNSLIYKTTDGGQNWTEEVPISVVTDLKSIYFIDEDYGIVVGEAGKLYIFENDTWTYQAYDRRLDFNQVTISDDGLAIIAADSGQVYLRPKDSMRFHEASGFVSTTPLLSVQSIEGNIYAAGGWFDDSLQEFTNVFLESLDSGKTFQELNTLDFDVLTDMHFVSKQKGYYLGRGTGFFATEDKLNSHYRLFAGTNNSLNDIFFLNEDMVFACGVVGTVTKSMHSPGWNTSLTELNAKVEVYPNPVMSQLSLRNANQVRELNIYDGAFHLILSRNTELESIDFSNFSPGFYLIQMTTKTDEIVSQKIIKQ